MPAELRPSGWCVDRAAVRPDQRHGAGDGFRRPGDALGRLYDYSDGTGDRYVVRVSGTYDLPDGWKTRSARSRMTTASASAFGLDRRRWGLQQGLYRRTMGLPGKEHRQIESGPSANGASSLRQQATFGAGNSRA